VQLPHKLRAGQGLVLGQASAHLSRAVAPAALRSPEEQLEPEQLLVTPSLLTLDLYARPG
jgi:hypothetical protein